MLRENFVFKYIQRFAIIVASSVNTAETEVMVSLLCLVCGSTYNCQTSVLGPVRDIA